MRATESPQEWEQLLEAVRADDYDEAQRICFKYGFDSETLEIDTRKFTYYWTSPDGEQGVAETITQMRDLLSCAPDTIRMFFARAKSDSVKVKFGRYTGWEITRVLIEEEK